MIAVFNAIQQLTLEAKRALNASLGVAIAWPASFDKRIANMR